MSPTMQQVTEARERLLKGLGPDASEEMRLSLGLLADAAAEHVRGPEWSQDSRAVFQALAGRPELEAAQRLALLADLGERYRTVSRGDFEPTTQQDWCDWYRMRCLEVARALAPVARRFGYVHLAEYLEGRERRTYYVPTLEPEVNALFERAAQAEAQLAEVREHWRAADEERAQMLSERDAALEKASEHFCLAEQQEGRAARAEARAESLQGALSRESAALAAHSGCITRLSMLFDCPSAFQDVEAMAAGWKARATVAEGFRLAASKLLQRQEVAATCSHSTDRNLLTEACPKCGGEVSPDTLWALLREFVTGPRGWPVAVELDAGDTWHAFECLSCGSCCDARAPRDTLLLMACPRCGRGMRLGATWPADSSGYGSRAAPGRASLPDVTARAARNEWAQRVEAVEAHLGVLHQRFEQERGRAQETEAKLLTIYQRVNDTETAACIMLGIPSFKGSGMPPSHKESQQKTASRLSRWIAYGEVVPARQEQER